MYFCSFITKVLLTADIIDAYLTLSLVRWVWKFAFIIKVSYVNNEYENESMSKLV